MENEIKEEELFIPKTKHKALKILLAIILIGALAAGGYFLYKEKFNNPNKTVTSIIEEAEKNIKNEINDTKVYKFNGVLKINANLSSEYKPITDIINKLDLQFIMESDAKNKLVNTTLNTKYKGDQLVDASMYIKDNAAYILLNDIYDKYLKFSFDDIKEESLEVSGLDIDEKDIKTITNSIIKAAKSALANVEFKRTSTTIKIDDNDRNVYNNYADFQDAEIKKFIKDIVNALANDEEFTKVFKKLVGDDAKITDLTEYLDKQTISGTYRLNFYTNKSIINQKLVSVRLETINDDAKTSINFDKISDDEVLLLIDTSGGTISSRVKKTNSVFNANLNVNILGMSVKLDLSSNYEKIKEVTKPDIENSKKIEDLTQEEQEAISEKIQKNKGVLSLVEDISKIK